MHTYVMLTLGADFMVQK